MPESDTNKLTEVERDAVRFAAREYAPDQYLSALLAPRFARDDLVTLAALSGEVHRIPFIVSDPNMGEIRLQWWRDALGQTAEGTMTGNPVADAVTEMTERSCGACGRLLSVIDAASFLFGSDAPDDDELERYLSGSAGGEFQLVAEVLKIPQSEKTSQVLSASAAAYGRTHLARELVPLLAKGRMPLPISYFNGRDPRDAGESDAVKAISAAVERLAVEARGHLDIVRKTLPASGPHLIHAVLPLSLIEPTFAVLRSPRRDRLRESAQISPLSRAIRLWLASWRGRV